ncbi:50S ribosomal protein L10 [Candidatus Peregrinibacteria bacterium]|jgi:large subunit ribosomal protein L10|nr:50S ribosomal protein L10 [Candidatus Peregrinibacteria bacterium]
MPLSKDQKQELLKELVEKMKESKSIVFANYSGTTVEEQTKLRKELLANNAELKVTKKTLIRLAAKELGVEGLSGDSLEGQIVLALSYEDPTVAAQTIKKHSKTVKALKLKGGIFEGKELGLSGVTELADLPPKDVLIAKLLGTLQAPIQGFASVGSGVVGGFVRVLNAHREKQEAAA